MREIDSDCVNSIEEVGVGDCGSVDGSQFGSAFSVAHHVQSSDVEAEIFSQLVVWEGGNGKTLRPVIHVTGGIVALKF